MNLKSIAIILLFLALTIHSQIPTSPTNYIQRRIYYNEFENVCATVGYDAIIWKFNFNDQTQSIEGQTFGGIDCIPWTFPYTRMIKVLPGIDFVSGHDVIHFKQEKIVHTVLQVVVSIDGRVTASNPVKIGGRNYNCAILGDSKPVHFGVPDHGHPVPKATVNYKMMKYDELFFETQSHLFINQVRLIIAKLNSMQQNINIYLYNYNHTITQIIFKLYHIVIIQNNNKVHQTIIMTWYQTQNQLQQAEWKKLIQNNNVSMMEILNSQDFITQLIKHGNPEVLTWVENNYRKFFYFLLIRCLVLPAESDSQDRKFKEPTQSIYLVCNIIDTMPSMSPTNLATNSSISSSISMMASMSQNSNPRIISSQAVDFIIDKLFTLYFQNDPNKLQNTLIPGYFNRIFQSLNRCHNSRLTDNLKSTQQGKLQKLLDLHGRYQQIIKCIQTILIVFITQSTNNINMATSIIMPNNTAPTVMVSPVGHPLQPNHPYKTKYGLLMGILRKIKDFNKLDIIHFQNLTNIILQIIKNVRNIFEGNSLGDTLCQVQNVKIFFNIALSNIAPDGLECQIKCIQICKYCLILMSPYDRSDMFNKFSQIVQQLMKTQKLSRKTNYMLQLLNQWYLIQSGQPSNFLLNASMNSSMRGSMNLNMSLNSSGYGNTMLKSCHIPHDLQQILCSHKIFQHLVRLCIQFPNCNIFHERVKNFIQSIFKSQNVPIIESVFKDNQIITQTVTFLKDFKQNPYFGFFVQLTRIYTSKRVPTPVIDQIVQINQSIWSQCYKNVLEPHVCVRCLYRLGEIQGVRDNQPLQFTVTKKQRSQENTKIDNKKQDSGKKVSDQVKLLQVNSTAVITPITLNIEKKQNEIQVPKQQESENIQPICLKFLKKQSQNSEDKAQTQSFQNFLKKKMGESNKLVDQRKKSRTPTKIASKSSKKNKWGANNDQNQLPNPASPKKSVSADQKPLIKQTISQSQPQQIIPKICLIKIKKQQNYNTMRKSQTKQRKINKENDAHLLKWIQKAKKNAKSIR